MIYKENISRLPAAARLCNVSWWLIKNNESNSLQTKTPDNSEKSIANNELHTWSAPQT